MSGVCWGSLRNQKKTPSLPERTRFVSRFGFQGTRSDFIVTQHPEFNLGRLASEKGGGPKPRFGNCLEGGSRVKMQVVSNLFGGEVAKIHPFFGRLQQKYP